MQNKHKNLILLSQLVHCMQFIQISATISVFNWKFNLLALLHVHINRSFKKKSGILKTTDDNLFR